MAGDDKDRPKIVARTSFVVILVFIAGIVLAAAVQSFAVFVFAFALALITEASLLLLVNKDWP
jgi:hypothetical protein